MRALFLVSLASLSIAGCDEIRSMIDERSSGEGDAQPPRGFAVVTAYEPVRFDGQTDDLLTGGLGLEGLRRTTPPEGASLRTLAIWSNFRAIVDVTEGGGFGTLTGPQAGQEKIPGTEYLLVLSIPAASQPFTVAVQVPDSFDATEPCLVLGPSSGSRGVYGAIGTASAWGLARGCAVALVDKMTGGGVYHLSSEEGYDAKHRLGSRSAGDLLFVPDETEELRAYRERRSDALAVKHAHSRDNVERFWGETVLAAGTQALDVLNRHFGTERFTPETVDVIAASISNGGRAVLDAAERDMAGLIDGVVAGEPNVLLADDPSVDLLAYAAGMNLYVPCAVLAPDNAGRPGAAASAAFRGVLEGWCANLARDGYIEGTSVAEQAAAAMARVRELGFLPETDDLIHYGAAIRLWPAVTMMYANAYGRFGVEDETCRVRYAYATPFSTPRPATEEEKRTHAALSSGAPPVAGVGLIAAGTGADAAYEATACFHRLAAAERDPRIAEGVAETELSGRLKAPAIVLHGRADALIPVTQSSRPYAARAMTGELPFAYLEIQHGQHFDAFLGQPDLAPLFVPMHVYFEDAADRMLAHVRDGLPLPASQVVRTVPRGEGAPLTRANVPSPETGPAAADRILEANGTLVVPQ